MLVIGLTGGIGSGKTTVANLFSELGVDIIDTDVISREIVNTGQTAFIKIIDYFGKHILDNKGQLDRQKLADITFNNTKKRKALESILHPIIKENMLSQIEKINAPYCIVVIPLLFEAKQKDLVDRVLVIDCKLEDQINRVKIRDKRPSKQIFSIIHSQISRDIRLKAADDIIKNSGNIHDLPIKVAELHKKYLQLGSQYASEL